MIKTLRKYSILWIILVFASQAGLSVNPVDTLQVFYKDTTLNAFLDRAITYQQRADSFYELSIKWRKEIMRMDDPVERTALQRRIADAEDSTGVYREMAGVYFAYVNSRLPVEKAN